MHSAAILSFVIMFGAADYDLSESATGLSASVFIGSIGLTVQGSSSSLRLPHWNRGYFNSA